MEKGVRFVAFFEGLIVLIISQTVFVVCSFITNVGLARIFGPETYGTYSLVNSILTWAQLFVMSGIQFALQKFVAEEPHHAHAIKRTGFRIQLVYSLVISVLVLGFSKSIANLFQDPGLVPYIRIVALNVFIFGLYRFYIGFQNGLRQFRTQAFIVIGFSVVRLAAIFTLVFLGFSIPGALYGTMIGVTAGMMIGMAVSRGKAGDERFDIRRLLRFAGPNVVYIVLVNVIYWLDLWFVRYFHGSTESGFYNAAGMISKMPNFLFMALSWIMLPLISRSIHQKEAQRTQTYIERSLRFVFLLFIPFVFIILSTSEHLISLIYSETYVPGAQSLRILIVGLFFLTLYTVINNILMADNRIGTLSLLTMGLIVLDVILNLVFVPSLHLNGAALATALTSLVGAGIVGVMVYRRFKTLIPYRTVIRGVVAAGVVFAISSMYQVQGIMLILNYVFLFTLYLGGLVILKEVGAQDFEAVRGLIVKVAGRKV